MAINKKDLPRPNRRSIHPPATTPEGRENQLIALAVDLAERQILEGTASAQVITHYLKMGSGRERIERLQIQHRNELLVVEKEARESAARTEEMYKEALNAMRAYSGQDVQEENYDY